MQRPNLGRRGAGTAGVLRAFIARLSGGADRRRLNWGFNNHLSNRRKATDSGSVITVRARSVSFQKSWSA